MVVGYNRRRRGRFPYGFSFGQFMATPRRRGRRNELRPHGRRLTVEQLERRLLLAADFGDAPAPYPTLPGSSGPSHEAVGPLLGALRDAEPNGQPHFAADGDGSDEDGVVFGVLRVGQTATMTVNVSNAPAGAKLDAWIDFNRDGNWTSVGDQIADNLTVTAGDNVISFNVPSAALGAHTYARVRLSTVGNLNPSGGLAAANGEVEDYVVSVVPADSGVFGGLELISFADATQIFPTDLDSDGDLDLFTNSAWIENVNGRFGPETQTFSGGLGAMAPADIDGDGDVDFFASTGSRLSWYENTGNLSFTQRTIDSTNSPAANVAVDVDGDGDVDVVSGASGDVTRYLNNGNQVFTKVVMTGSLSFASALSVVDMDGDADLDILAGSNSGQPIQWLENGGNGVFTPHNVTAGTQNVGGVATADLDGDGDMDVLAAVTSVGIVWYENDGAQNFASHTLDAATWFPLGVSVADLDSDGDVDVAASGSNRVFWYENDGGEVFTRRTIVSTAGSHYGVVPADLDGDGRLDLVTAGTGSTPIGWYRQLAEYDFGDVPRSYGSASVQGNGARHNAAGPRLGALRDAESQGSHEPAGAELEDDGVTFGTVSMESGVGTITVDVQNAPAGAKLDGWIDFDGDGAWSGAEAQIFGATPVSAGSNVLAFAVPSGAVPGVTYARFRLSTEGGLGVHGAALDGEVEDYSVTILPRAPATGLFGGPTAIAASAAFAMAVADLDGDGDPDVVTHTFDGFKGVEWHENRGAGGFIPHVIASHFSTGLSSDEIQVADLDSDGDLDVVGMGSSLVIWYENDGQQSFTRRTAAVNVPTFAGGHVVADIDADGDRDIVMAGGSGSVYCLLNDGDQQFTTRLVGTTGSFPRSVAVADVDRDGNVDVIVAGGSVSWFQHNGALGFVERELPLAPISSFGGRADYAVPGDLDGDGDLDIVATANSSGSGYSVAWYEQIANNEFVGHPIQAGGQARGVTPADFDADGDLDILAIGNAGTLDLYENVDSTLFLRRQLAASLSTVYSPVAVADMDGDGDLDAVASQIAGSAHVVWFENFDLVDPDYGDAPAPYPVTRAGEGPVHNGVGPRLGTARDVEADGQPTAHADGDDVDDDGVAFGDLQVGGASGSVVITVENAPGGARVDAWIDFNGDGSFGGSEEQILGAVLVAEGDNAFTFAVPATAEAGVTFARVRISTAGGLGPRGAALDGEVEDYELTVAPLAESSGQFGKFHYLASNIESAQIVRTADIDGDGDADILAGGGSNQTAWYESLGDGAFLRHTIGLTTSPIPLGLRAADFDRDGDADIVVIHQNGVGWFENNGEESFNYRAPTSTVSELRGVFDLADVDGDGDLDIIASRIAGNSALISILFNDGRQGFPNVVPLTTPTYIATGIRAADMDGDGDMDFAASFALNSGGAIAWYENIAATFTLHTVSSGTPVNGRDVAPRDFDGDGDMDIVALSSGAVEWFDNDGQQSFTRRVVGVSAITSAGGTPVAVDRVQAVDVDGDGDLDVLVSNEYSYRWFRRESLTSFTYIEFHTQSNTVAPLAIADLDGNGTIEVIGSSSSGARLFWMESWPVGDYTRDGVVNEADRTLYEQTLGNAVSPPGFGADGDHSGTIDAPDLAIWQGNVGAAAKPLLWAANYNQDERIDGNDILIWQRLLGTTYPGPGHANDPDFSGAVDAGDLQLLLRQFGQGVTPNYAWINASPAETNLEASADPAAAASVVAADEPTISDDVILQLDWTPVRTVRPRYAPPRRLASAEVRDTVIAAYLRDADPRGVAPRRPSDRPADDKAFAVVVADEAFATL